MSDESTQFRNPTDSEREMLEQLGKRAQGLRASWLDGLRVREMADSGMGSLSLSTEDMPVASRVFGKTVAECRFRDADGVEVIVSLNVDQDGQPFEMDVWKTDFSPVIELRIESERKNG